MLRWEPPASHVTLRRGTWAAYPSVWRLAQLVASASKDMKL